MIAGVAGGVYTAKLPVTARDRIAILDRNVGRKCQVDAFFHMNSLFIASMTMRSKSIGLGTGRGLQWAGGGRVILMAVSDYDVADSFFCKAVQ